jgi:5'-3' exonuclease
MLEAGMKPVFVFDGKPPEMKSKELAKRKEGRDAADADLATAKEVCACSHALRAPIVCISLKAVVAAGPVRDISSAAARALLFREARACIEALTRCGD